MTDPTFEHRQAAQASTVCVVLCTYNGSAHIEQQVDSILQQAWPTAIRAFDDGSTDGTVELLNDLLSGRDAKIISNNTNLGFVKNFELAIRQTINEGFDYIALSDQDDLWEPTRIANGMQAMLDCNQVSPDSPTLVHSDLRMINEQGQDIAQSFLDYRGYDITGERNVATILGQNGVMGNTILMNRALATMALPFPPALHVHDYWLALVCELFGKRVMLPQPEVAYRIHSSNTSNSASSTRFGWQKMTRDKSLKGGWTRDFRLPFKEDNRAYCIEWLLQHEQHYPAIKPEDRQLLQVFLEYLHFESPRFFMLANMLNGGFFRSDWRHRLRVAFSLLTTRRYSP